MKQLSCLLEIEHQYNSLTVTEKRIADYIVENSAKVPLMTIDELANNANAAKSAVMRLCKSLGFSGFPELKISLATDISKNSVQKYSSYITPEDNALTALKKVFASNIRALDDTLTRIDMEQFSAIIDSLYTANHIYIYGIGSSGFFALDLSNRLSELGYLCFTITDVSYMKGSSLNVKPGDVVLAISQSGRTKIVVEAVEIAKKKGAITACITGYSNSPIRKASDYSIVITTNDIKYPIESISCRVATISVMDAIMVALTTKKYDDATNRMHEFKHYVNELRTSKNK